MTITRKPKCSTAIVIGGGVVGLACALHLRSRGIDTEIIDDRPERPPASWGNAGHIAVEQVEPLASLATLRSFPGRLFSRGGALALPPRDFPAWFPFACRLARASLPHHFAAGTEALRNLVVRALPAWRRLVAMTGDPDQLVEDGHYVVWESAASARKGREFWSNAEKGEVIVRDVTREEAARIGSLIARSPIDAMRFEGTARVRDPGRLLRSLGRAFETAGGIVRKAAITRVLTGNGAATVEFTNGTRTDAQIVVVAAGVRSARLLRPLGHRVPLIAERGYHIQAPAAWPDMPPVVFEDRSMIVTRFDSGLRAASFVEFARADSPPDPRKWERLRQHARELRLPFEATLSEWMGARPTLPDYLPAIGRTRGGNLLYAFGHQHLGLTLAAITGEIIGALAAAETPDLSLEPFAIERF